VDELCDFSPALDKDEFFSEVDVDIPYTVSSEKYRDSVKSPRLQGSAEHAYVHFYVSKPTVSVDYIPQRHVSVPCVCHFLIPPFPSYRRVLVKFRFRTSL